MTSTSGAELEAFARLPVSPTRILIAVGDVSGKGAPAALYAALVSGILRSLAPRRLPPARLLTALNDQLQERKLDAQYVTMLAALWDDATRTLHLANAGSVQPLVVRRADFRADVEAKPTVHTIPVEGFPLGLFPLATYDEVAVPLTPGDSVVFFSDGIVDALDPAGQQFGAEQLCALLQSLSASLPTAAEAAARINEAVAAHQAGTAHFDDETVVVLHVI